ncbi:nitrous oxidase accessory protein [Thioalbus denitrificans]|uniref:Nitrous oxidase accessory protein n=1 Tax=Thioalbus denitrificans TaxID=547122 RepID=A0A369CH69_9GAMM|nr:nitrous oxidase accessory protein [Thioalbus denitrificans]
MNVRHSWLPLLALWSLLFAGPARALPPLQIYVAITPPGGVLRLDPGTYGGPAVIDKPITIDGGGEVTLDGQGEGTVLTIRSDGVTVKGMRITHSGNGYDAVDGGVWVEDSDGVVLEDLVIDDVLHGISLQQSDNATVRGNRITSRDVGLSLRGDGIRLWNSHDNLIENNEVVRVRDIVLTNSSGNRLIGNTIRDGRIAIEFIYSPENSAEHNLISGNITGIFSLYSDDLSIRGNRIQNVRKVPGIALAFKESSQVVVEENEILHCAVGLEANSPVYPENLLYIRHNHFAYNDIAMYFYGEKGGHLIHDNRFEENFLPVAVTVFSTVLDNDWRGNYWDDYEGFDRDDDGIGDKPYEVYLYADRIWLDRPMIRFFRRSPVLELVDFMERLAPFSDPPMILRDPAPRVR